MMRLVIYEALNQIELLQRLYIEKMEVRRSDLLQTEDIISPPYNQTIESLSDSDVLIYSLYPVDQQM